MSSNAEEIAQNQFLHKVYDIVPRHYRLVNSVITWGLDRKWRRQAAKECLVNKPGKVLDIGCGTGDLTIELLLKSGEDVEITGVDFNRNMMRIAEERVEKSGYGSRVSFVSGEVANLPFPAEHFESVGAAFAFRNLTYKNPMAENNIAEVLRVLKTGGRFVTVETSQPKPGLIKYLCHIYVRCFVFLAGALISGSSQPYRYLVDSTVNYYTPEELRQILLQAGFSKVNFYQLFYGAASIHIAIK